MTRKHRPSCEKLGQEVRGKGNARQDFILWYLYSATVLLGVFDLKPPTSSVSCSAVTSRGGVIVSLLVVQAVRFVLEYCQGKGLLLCLSLHLVADSSRLQFVARLGGSGSRLSALSFNISFALNAAPLLPSPIVLLVLPLSWAPRKVVLCLSTLKNSSPCLNP